MGAVDSKHMGDMPQDSVTFTEDEVHRLFKRFLRIDADQNGELDIEEFLSLNKVSENPLSHRFLQLFDSNKNETVDFNEFLSGLSVFGKFNNHDEKVQFFFKIYDTNDDGFISNGDLYRALKMMVGDNLGDIQLQQVVDKTIREADLDGDGKLSFEEFKLFIEDRNKDLLCKLSIINSV